VPGSNRNLTEAPATNGTWRAGVESLLIFVVFALYAGWPVPEPNESHYLSKAKHYWNRSWLADDFFLESADSHATFYITAGWLTRFLDLPDVARVGRVLTWALLAFYWRRLSWSLAPWTGASILSAALLVGLNERFQMAGEWIVGGFEAKGLAYAMVLAALGELVRGRWNLTWLYLGAATAFHVLVGGWATVAVGVCWIASGAARPRIAAMLPGMAGFALLAGPVVWQSLALTRGVDATAIATANDICVFRRIPHHLFFYSMNVGFRWRFAALVAIWAALAWLTPTTPGAKRLRVCVWASVGLAAIGVALSTLALWQPEFAARWLRFYWFRLADVFVPLGIAITAVQFAWQTAPRIRWGRALAPVALCVIAAALLGSYVFTVQTTETPRADKATKTANLPDWRDVCLWVSEHTPADARFITHRPAQTFRWYAGRSEVATNKDMPQDARSLVEWWDRLEAIHATGNPEQRWHHSLTELDPARLERLGKTYGAQYVLTDAAPALAFPCVYRNGTYAVYQLSTAGSEAANNDVSP